MYYKHNYNMFIIYIKNVNIITFIVHFTIAFIIQHVF